MHDSLPTASSPSDDRRFLLNSRFLMQAVPSPASHLMVIIFPEYALVVGCSLVQMSLVPESLFPASLSATQARSQVSV